MPCLYVEEWAYSGKRFIKFTATCLKPNFHEYHKRQMLYVYSTLSWGSLNGNLFVSLKYRSGVWTYHYQGVQCILFRNIKINFYLICWQFVSHLSVHYVKVSTTELQAVNLIENWWESYYYTFIRFLKCISLKKF